MKTAIMLIKWAVPLALLSTFTAFYAAQRSTGFVQDSLMPPNAPIHLPIEK